MKVINFFLLNKVRQSRVKLCRVSIDGFKNVNSSNVFLDKIVALVSLNSYGKSNLLQAIDFGVDFIKNNEETKKKMMSWAKAIPLNKTNASRDFRIELEMLIEVGSKLFRVIYGYQFKWIRDDELGACIVGEWLKAKLDEKNQKYNSLISREGDNTFYRSSESGRCNTKIVVEQNNLIINKLKAYDDLYYYEIIKSINSLKVYIDRHLDASHSYSPDRIIRKNIEALELEIEDSNLPRVIYQLKQIYPEKYHFLISAYLQLFPQIKEIIVKELTIPEIKEKLPDNLPFKVANEIYILYVIDEKLNQPISFENMSDGAKRIFLLLTNIIIANILNYVFFAVEEPENSIHPSLFQNYLSVLSQFTEDCQVIIASHSPYIIQYLEPSCIYIGLPREDGIAQFRNIHKSAQKHLINDAFKFDMSIGDYIFELLSGTKEDIKSIENYLETSINE